VGRARWWALGIGAACFLFYLGGSYSFRYTHVCAHSHKKVVVEATHDTQLRTITVCDAYSGNGKHWSPGDPARALYSEPLTGWNEAIVIGIALAIVAAALYELLYERRKNRRGRRTERA
jgi:hypothetical protein